MRNETFTLPHAIANDTRKRAAMLTTARDLGRPVVFDYTKAGATASESRTGTVVSVGGDLTTNKGHVVLDTDKGPRTFSLYLMANVRDAA